jgi:hypothetical protein
MAIDDIVDLPYLTQSCLGQAWNRALLLIPVTFSLPRVHRTSNVAILAMSFATSGATRAVLGRLSPEAHALSSPNQGTWTLQSEAAAIDCGPTLARAPLLGTWWCHWAGCAVR